MFSLYRRLFTYVPLATTCAMIAIAVAAFALASLANTLAAHLMSLLEVAWNEAIPFWRIWAPIGFIGVAFARGFGNVIGNYAMQRLTRKIILSLRNHLAQCILQLPQAFFRQQRQGTVQALFSYHCEQIESSIGGGLIVLLRESMTVIALFTYLLYLNWLLTLELLVLLPLLAVLINAASKAFRRYSHRIQNSLSRFSSQMHEFISVREVIKLANSQPQETRAFATTNTENYHHHMKLALINTISVPLISVLIGAGIGCIMWQVLNLSLPTTFASYGLFAAYITATGIIIKPIRQLTTVIALIQRGLAAAEEIFSIIDAPTEIDNGSRVLASQVGTIEFINTDVAFGATTVLTDINLVIAAGASVAFVGESGSGKTTLTMLLTRFITASKGSVRINGCDINSYSLTSVRQQIAMVTQNPTFFSRTIAENISYPHQTIDAALLQQSIEFANLDEVIATMAHGVDTQVGNNADQLSGGQRQRLALARAFYKQAPILLLDEATAALDNQSDFAIQQALATMIHSNTTLIVVAHRLSSIVHLDTIVVFKKGRIIDQGSHTQLMERCSYYQNLYRLQQR